LFALWPISTIAAEAQHIEAWWKAFPDELTINTVCPARISLSMLISTAENMIQHQIVNIR
jgi:hypothetical protein